MERTKNGSPSLAPGEYLVEVDGVVFRVSRLSEHEILVDGKKHHVDCSTIKRGMYSLLVDNESFNITGLVDATDNILQALAVNGHNFSVRLDDWRSLMKDSILKTHGIAKKTDVIRAPMPGLVVRVEVKAGEEVRAGQGLVVLEAMKMENEIKALEGGTIDKVFAQQGRVVEKNEPLVSLLHNSD